MHDVRSKSPPWGYASRSNSGGLPNPPPLGLDIDRCIKKQQTWTRLVNWGNCNSTSKELNKVGLWERINMYVTEILSSWRTHLSSPSVCRYVFFPLVLYFPAAYLRLHFWRQTGWNPGCSVTHVNSTSEPISWSTKSLFIDSWQPSSSLQQ